MISWITFLVPYVFNEYKKEEMNIAERKYHNYSSYYSDGSTTISDCMSPLNFAIEKNNIEIVKLLLAVKDIDINFERKYSKKGSGEYRGECDDDVIKERTTLLYQAVKNKNNEIVQLLISNENINVNIKNYLYANHENYYGVRDTEFNNERIIKNETSLYLAFKKGYAELVQVLLSNNNYDVNLENSYYAVKNENQEEEENKNKNVETPLHRAVKDSNIGIIKLLLRHSKINLDVKDSEKNKPIHYIKDQQIKELFRK